jgi:hypothetical protein
MAFLGFHLYSIANKLVTWKQWRTLSSLQVRRRSCKQLLETVERIYYRKYTSLGIMPHEEQATRVVAHTFSIEMQQVYMNQKEYPAKNSSATEKSCFL